MIRPLPRRRVALLLGVGGCASRPALDAAVADAATDWSRAEALTVVMDDHSFAPSTLRLRVNAPYRLVLRNRGGKAHDFTAPEFFRATATRAGDPVAAAMRATGGRVDVGAGATRDLALLPLAVGRYELECVKPLHAILGMTGEIIVSA